MAIRILTDSACDLTPQEAEKMGIDLIPLKTYFGEEEYRDGIDLDHDGFFQKLIETDVFPTTSQISPYEYEEKFRQMTKNGDEVLCITISSKLSGCYQSAWIAAKEFEGKVYLVDSENACIGERILVEYACRLKNENYSVQEMVQILDKKKKDIRVLALIDTLEYLKKGGRISAVTAIAGNLLSIKPVIAIMHGEVVVVGKARGSKAGNNKLSEMISQEGDIDFSMPLCLAYSGLSDILLRKYMADFRYMYEGKIDELPISSIGSVIGTHIGPGGIAVAFFVER